MPHLLFTPRLTFFSFLSSLNSWPIFSQNRTLSSFKPCTFFGCISPKKFLFLENSSPLLTLLFWPAFCWQVPGAHQNHWQESSHLTFLLTLDCWPLFPGLPKQHSPVLFSQVPPHMYLTQCGMAVFTHQSIFFCSEGKTYSLNWSTVAWFSSALPFLHWARQSHCPLCLHLSKGNHNYICVDVWPKWSNYEKCLKFFGI